MTLHLKTRHTQHQQCATGHYCVFCTAHFGEYKKKNKLFPLLASMHSFFVNCYNEYVVGQQTVTLVCFEFELEL